MVKGEALLFLAGHFFSRHNSTKNFLQKKILKKLPIYAITGHAMS
jgi:hypothetical protein